MSTPGHKIPSILGAVARRESAAALEELAGIKTVVIATIDGFDIASASVDGSDAARVAATASSISAIGDVVSQESHLGRSRCVIIDTESGFAVVHSVRRPDIDLIVSMIADSSAVLGRINHRAAQLARLLAET